MLNTRYIGILVDKFVYCNIYVLEPHYTATLFTYFVVCTLFSIQNVRTVTCPKWKTVKTLHNINCLVSSYTKQKIHIIFQILSTICKTHVWNSRERQNIDKSCFSFVRNFKRYLSLPLLSLLNITNWT